MPFLNGLDLGKKGDYSAFCPIEQTKQENGDFHYTLRHLERYELGLEYPIILKMVGQRMQHPSLKGSRLIVDYTGVGAPVFDMMKERRHLFNGARLIPILITGGERVSFDNKYKAWHVSKKVLAANLQSLFEESRISIPDKIIINGINFSEKLIEELVNFQVKITKSANEKFEHREGQHDDLVLSVALATWLGEYTGSGKAADISSDDGEDSIWRGIPPEAMGILGCQASGTEFD